VNVKSPENAINNTEKFGRVEEIYRIIDNRTRIYIDSPWRKMMAMTMN
jgi:hypothetical protein